MRVGGRLNNYFPYPKKSYGNMVLARFSKRSLLDRNFHLITWEWNSAIIVHRRGRQVRNISAIVNCFSERVQLINAYWNAKITQHVIHRDILYFNNIGMLMVVRMSHVAWEWVDKTLWMMINLFTLMIELSLDTATIAEISEMEDHDEVVREEGEEIPLFVSERSELWET